MTNYFELLTSDPVKAVQFYAQDATLTWVNFKRSNKIDNITILGRHSIHQFYKTIPEYVFEVSSYDTQTVISQNAPNITVLVVYGNMYPVETEPREPYKFQCSMHIQMNEGERRAAISYHLMNIFEMPI